MRSLTQEYTWQLLSEGIALARQRQLPPMALVILDARGVIKAAFSEDGVGTLRPAIAQGKANAALGMGFDTREFERLRQAGVLSDAFSSALSCASYGQFNPNPGGVLLQNEGGVIGAVGASGAAAADDEALLRALLSH
ncbi:heme-binding protein [Gilvimarinus sp. SDUM040013]|uniref:Heme-binding protein n=1 Tax=Gilvimarinus gilvus TaxID=3058038 RepID=A0ABU4S3Q6_9GAMM|nr:heme-binding protein [Gilvimarinus sp. SDUM040013]MDO3387806.1 heme-binding protein [Gilvimarinus sp. SDUM040013]MDX6851051.1 heme-binding protein [Gilvimarinus sp. SDUM040013]